MRRYVTPPAFVVVSLALASSAHAVEDKLVAGDVVVAEDAAQDKAGDNTARPDQPRALDGLQIEDKLGAKVPLDVALIDERGQKVKLGDYFSGAQKGKPVLLTLGYYECPMLCSLVLNATLDALKQVDLRPGRDFTWVSVSFAKDETHELAAKKRANYLKTYLNDSDDKDAAEGWHFHVGDEAEVKRLADAVGFRYRWDDKSQQYAHAAGIFFLGADGTLSRTLFGVSYDPTDVKLALLEASNGAVGTITDRIFLSCFSYTPDKQRYGVYVFGVMRLAGVLTILLLGGFLFILWRRERQSTRAAGMRGTNHG